MVCGVWRSMWIVDVLIVYNKWHRHRHRVSRNISFSLLYDFDATVLYDFDATV